LRVSGGGHDSLSDTSNPDTNPSVAVLSAALGVEIREIERVITESGGAHSSVYTCHTGEGELILRLAHGKQGYYTHYFEGRVDWSNWLDQHWAISQAIEAGVPAPELVASHRASGAVLMKRLPGSPIDSRYDEVWNGCPYDEREFGVLLRRMHSIRPSGWGPIDDYGAALFETWTDFLAEAAHSALELCRSRGSLPTALSDALMRNWVPRLPDIECAEPSLLHMESLGFANIMVEPATHSITGLLDYEDCLGGDPLFEFVWMRYYFEHDSLQQKYFDFDRFQSGYGMADLDISQVRLYEPFPLLDKLRWIPCDGDRARQYCMRLESMLALLK
jgi:aminoglycoside phosphotransferase (APT) family kinase protein